MAETERSREMLHTARLYSEVAKYVNKSENPAYLIPSQVIAALALELYFKTLYHIENGTDFKINNRHSHNFVALFQALTDDARSEIEAAFNQALRTRNMNDIRQIEAFGRLSVSTEFAEILKTWSEVFTEVRYLYEEKSHKNMVFFPEVEGAVAARIRKVRPDWD
jgi:hypothetical protein